jgi:hypothetical protein
MNNKGKYSYSTKAVFSGPWLLDDKALIGLDSIFEKYWFRFEKRRKSLLEASLVNDYRLIWEQSVSKDDLLEKIASVPSLNPHSRNIKQVSILYDGHTFECDSISTALTEISLVSKVPHGFTYYLSSSDVECKVELNTIGGLEVFTSPDNLPLARNMYTELIAWVEKYTAPFWLRWWSKLAKSGLRFYVFLLGLILSISLLNRFIKWNNSLLKSQEQAHFLVEGGINSQNISEAIKLLLQTQIIDRISIQSSSTIWFLVAVVIMGIVLSVRPNVVMGIGKGSSYIRVWRWWLRFISVSVPLFFLTFIILPRLASWIESFISLKP